MAMVALIPNRLSLAPVGARLQSTQTRLSLADVTAPGFRGGKYQVCHYPESASGTCGPPALDQVLTFAHELLCRLKSEETHLVVEYAEEERRFAAVLVGAFLVLARGWSSSQVCSRMREESRLIFPCSWRRQGVMCVQACWEGLQTARELGWVLPSMVEDAAECERAASEFWNTIVQYDGSWLIPGKIFVMADPTTVVMDPNPRTCPSLFPSGKEIAKDDASTSAGTPLFLSTRSHSVVSFAIDCDELEPSTPRSPSADHGHPADRRPSQSSVESVCKDFAMRYSRDSVFSVCKGFTQAEAHSSGDAGGAQQQQPQPLVTFLKEQGIASVVRANMIHEPGLSELGGSYDARLLEPYGLQHADVPVRDTDGSVPDEGDIRLFLDAVSQMGFEAEGRTSNDALAIHCKSGFGRSVVFACLLAIYLHNVSGRAVMGWSRLVRPGAVISPQEESLLLKLSGRADLLRYRRAAHMQEADGAATPACGCIVQ